MSAGLAVRRGRMSVMCVMAPEGTERVCLSEHCQPAEGRMLCLCRSPEQAQPCR